MDLDEDIAISGTHKVVTIMKAFDSKNKQIGKDICLEIRGELQQI